MNLFLMEYFQLHIIVNLCILWKYANCIESITGCFKEHKGVCIELIYNCPFTNGIDMINNRRQLVNDPMCPKDRRCCIPPKKEDAFTYKSYDSDQCGISQTHNRVAYGFKVKPKEYPWYTAIMFKNRRQLCGATLIDPSWVLSAAHCFSSDSVPEDYHVVFGIDNKHNVENAQAVQVKKIKRKENYKPGAFHLNDIALLKLARPVTLNSFVNLACLPNENENFDNMVCMASGLGRIETNNRTIDVLQVALPIVPTSKCRSQLSGQSSITEPDDVNVICAGYEGGLYDTCAGDSGGPLVCLKKDAHGIERFILAGLTSFGPPECGNTVTYAGYTNITNYLPWINKVILTNSTEAVLRSSIILIYFIVVFSFIVKEF